MASKKQKIYNFKSVGSEFILDTPEKIEEWFDKYAKNHSFYGFDTETVGLNGPLVGFSLAIPNVGGWYVPVDHRTLFDINLISYEQVTKYFKAFFEAPYNIFCGWNIGYDVKTMWKYDINIPRSNREDCMILGWLINETAPRRLKDRAVWENIVDQTTKLNDLVTKGQSQNVSAEIMAPYAIQDAVLPLRMYPGFVQKVKEMGLLKLYVQKEIPFSDVLIKAERNGIMIRPDVLKEVDREAKQEMGFFEELIYEQADESFMISSNDQLAYILHEKMNLPVFSHTEKTHEPQVNKENLEKLEKEGFKIAEFILKYRKAEKLQSSFTYKLIEEADANLRIHPSFKHVGTKTGRLSCSDPNLQQIPRNKVIRSAFAAPEGRRFVLADYSQLELRVLAHFSQDEAMVEAFRTGKDLHSVTAAKIFNLTYEEVQAHVAAKRGPGYEARQKAKTVNFGIVYGKGIDLYLGITAAFLEMWADAHPGAKAYIDGHKLWVKDCTGGTTYTLSGRSRTDKGVFSQNSEISSSAFRALFSAHIQGSAADIVKEAMLQLDELYETMFPTAKLLLQVHDEVITEVDIADAEEVAKRKQYIMENAWKLNNVPLVADPAIGTSWADKA